MQSSYQQQSYSHREDYVTIMYTYLNAKHALSVYTELIVRVL